MTEITYYFRRCRVVVWQEGRYLETQFEDGAVCPAAPQEDDDYWLRARDLGYHGDVWRMCREHELCHTWLMEMLGWEWSPTLRAVATGRALEPAPGDEALWGREQALVLSFQAFLNGGPCPDPPGEQLCRRRFGSLEWHVLRVQAVALFRSWEMDLLGRVNVRVS